MLWRICFKRQSQVSGGRTSGNCVKGISKKRNGGLPSGTEYNLMIVYRLLHDFEGAEDSLSLRCSSAEILHWLQEKCLLGRYELLAQCTTNPRSVTMNSFHLMARRL